ncbi:hypothetical protein V565_072560 [Rhizoctonia solani 123E]|uniref:Uncharacterized protein n=1 Tax=Rhizoctonia solani 123E TaxID=1423351 RepID=A0A074RZW0_9AGAM|nr:hypothetical protein V565_072560 [Rhizoctonia solani 123E]
MGIIWLTRSQGGDFVVLPSSNSSCLGGTSDAAGLSQRFQPGRQALAPRESAVPPLPAAAEQALPTQEQDHRTLEQRAEQLSPPELERLAALVARRLERVRGAPPQYQATEGIGV